MKTIEIIDSYGNNKIINAGWIVQVDFQKKNLEEADFAVTVTFAFDLTVTQQTITKALYRSAYCGDAGRSFLTQFRALSR